MSSDKFAISTTTTSIKNTQTDSKLNTSSIPGGSGSGLRSSFVTVSWKPQQKLTPSKIYVLKYIYQTILGVSSLNQIKSISGKMGGKDTTYGQQWSSYEIYPGKWLCYKNTDTSKAGNITRMILITFELVINNSGLLILDVEAGYNTFTGQPPTSINSLTEQWKGKIDVNLARSDSDSGYGIFDLQLEIDTYNTLIVDWNGNENNFIKKDQSQKLSLSTQLSEIKNISGLCGGAYIGNVSVGRNWYTFKDTETDSIWYCYFFASNITRILQITFALTDDGYVKISNIVAKYNDKIGYTTDTETIKSGFQNGKLTSNYNTPPVINGVAASNTENGYGLYNLQIQIGDTLPPPVPSPELIGSTVFVNNESNIVQINIQGELSEDSYKNKIDKNDIVSVNIGTNVTSIGQNAFFFAENLKKVTFADNSKLETIGISGFSKTSITEIIIPQYVTSIAYNTFNFSPLTNASINVKMLGKSNFPSSDGPNQTIGGKSGVNITTYEPKPEPEPEITTVTISGKGILTKDIVNSNIGDNYNTTPINVVIKGFTEISGGQLFVKYTKNLVQVTIPNTVTKIGEELQATIGVGVQVHFISVLI